MHAKKQLSYGYRCLHEFFDNGSVDSYVYALNASNGSPSWSSHLGGSVYSSPTVAGGVVYVGSDDGNVYALNAGNGSQIWHYTTNGYIDTSPAIADGMVYVGSGDGYVYALNADTGAQYWSFRSTHWPFHTGGYWYSSPAIASGVVYVGFGDGYVYALNAATGAQYWSFGTGGYVFSSPAVIGGMVYVGSFDGYVYALGAISLSPTSGAVGSTVTFRAAGLLSSTSVTATFGNTPVTLSSSTTDASGSLSATFTVPASSAGNHTFTLSDGLNIPTASFWTTSAVSLSPTSGRVGSTVTVIGTGFAASSTITATFGGSPVTLNGTTSTDAAGSFSGATFTVPSSTAGIKSVVITDGSSNSASNTYNVTSVIQPVTAAMSGSAPSATVIMTGGNPSPSTFLADGNPHSIILDQGSTFTLSFNNSGNARCGFIVSSVFSATSVSYTASTTPISVTAYLQLSNTFSVSGVSGIDSVALTGTLIWGVLRRPL